MKTKFLFPYWCKYLGVACFIAHVPIVLFIKFRKEGFASYLSGIAEDSGIFSSHHLFFVFTTLLMLSGLVLFAFSKEKIEDEQISQQRLDSLMLTVYGSYILLIISLALTPDKDLSDTMHMFIWLPLVLFIIVFRWKMFRNSRYTKEGSI